MKEKLYTTNQAARILNRSRRLIQRFCKQGRFGTKFGDMWVITGEELDRFKKLKRPSGKKRH